MMWRTRSKEEPSAGGRRRAAWRWGSVAAVLGLVATAVALATWDAVVRERMRIVANQLTVLKPVDRRSGGDSV